MKGLYQWVDVGTGGANVVDMLGGPITFGAVRTGVITTWERFGGFNTMIMGGRTRMAFEATLDTSIRTKVIGGISAIQWGNTLGGMNINGKPVHFLTDRILSATFARPQYQAPVAGTGAPATIPTVSVATSTD